MSRIRAKDTKPELIVRGMVHALGRRFRLHAADLAGKPDLVNRKGHWAIFVHGCFWHSHEGCRLASNPRSNEAYWTEKLDGNRRRDQANRAALVDAGYRVLTIWECEVMNRGAASEALTSFFASVPASGSPFRTDGE